MSITTRDLKLRQKEVEKNLNESYSTLRKQPEGGLGAMIQKPNHNEPPIKRTPILFTPSPMLSSLPYLAEWVKYRSNENAINITAHLIRQREAAKASFEYDEIKQNDLDMRNDRILETASRNFTPSTADLLRKYLSDEIDKSRNEERKIQEQRMKRVDLELNPVRPEAPAVAPPVLRTLTAGDMGRPNVPDQAEIRALRNAYYDKQEAQRQQTEQAKARAGEAGRQVATIVNEAKDQAVKRKFSNMAEGLVAKQNEGALNMIQQLRKFKEDETNAKLRGYTKSSLEKLARGIAPAEERVNIPALGRPASSSELKKTKHYNIETITQSKAKGMIKKIPYDYLESTTGAGRPAVGGGGGGGALRAEELGRLAKGVI